MKISAEYMYIMEVSSLFMGVTHFEKHMHRLVLVYTCQNVAIYSESFSNGEKTFAMVLLYNVSFIFCIIIFSL